MALCETCGNEYEKSFQVILAGEKHNFDSFECARAHLRPLPMPHRESRRRANGTMYCCMHCAEAARD